MVSYREVPERRLASEIAGMPPIPHLTPPHSHKPAPHSHKQRSISHIVYERNLTCIPCDMIDARDIGNAIMPEATLSLQLCYFKSMWKRALLILNEGAFQKPFPAQFEANFDVWRADASLQWDWWSTAHTVLRTPLSSDYSISLGNARHVFGVGHLWAVWFGGDSSVGFSGSKVCLCVDLTGRSTLGILSKLNNSKWLSLQIRVQQNCR